MMMMMMMMMTTVMMMVLMTTTYVCEFNEIHTFTTAACDICESNCPYLLISFPLQSRRVAYKLETLFKWATKYPI
jgi:ferredoxin